MSEDMIYVDDSVQEDTPEFAVFGAETRAIVEASQGGVIAYVHRDNVDAMRDAWAFYRRKAEK